MCLLILFFGTGSFAHTSFAEILPKPGDLIKDGGIVLLDVETPIKVDLSKTEVIKNGWSISENNIIFVKQAVVGDDGTVYVSVTDLSKGPGEPRPILQAYSPFGSKLWSFEYDGSALSEPFLGPDNGIYLGVGPNKLLMINKKGKLEKTYNLKYVPNTLFGFGPDGHFYYTNTLEAKNGLLISYDPTLDQIRWTRNNINPNRIEFGKDGTVYYTSMDKKSMSAVLGGTLIWRYEVSSKEIGHYTIGKDGALYFFSYEMKENAQKSPVLPVLLEKIDSLGNWERANTYNVLNVDLQIGHAGEVYFAYNKILYSLDHALKTRWKLGGFQKYFRSTIGESGTIYLSDIYDKYNAKQMINIAALSDGTPLWTAAIEQNDYMDYLTEGPEGNVYYNTRKKLDAIIPKKLTQMKLNKPDLSLPLGQSEILQVTAEPYKVSFPHVKWSSSNPSVASVDQDGKVVALTPGQAQITAAALDDSVSVSSSVSVAAAPPAPASPEMSSSFSDIEGHQYKSFIHKAAELGIATGYEDGTFKPEGKVTRAEFAVLLMRALKPDVSGQDLTFKDKQNIGSWAVTYIAQAVQIGAVKGYSDGTFKPADPVTHAEMVNMVMGASGLPLTETSNKTGYDDDSAIPGWARAAVYAAEKNGIIVVDESGGKFNSKISSTRAEAVTIIVRLLEWMSKK